MTAVSHSHRRRTHCVRSKLKSDIAGFKPDGFDVPSFFAAGNRVATGPASQPGFHFEMTLFASPLFFGQRRLFREQQTMSSITPAERWFKVTRSPRLPTLCAFLRKLQEVVCTPQHGLPRAPGTAIDPSNRANKLPALMTLRVRGSRIFAMIKEMLFREVIGKRFDFKLLPKF